MGPLGQPSSPASDELEPAPPALLDATTGTAPVGRYRGLIPDLDTSHWDGSLGLLSARRTMRKTWVFVGAFSARFMVGFAVVDAGLLGTAFAYVFDRERGRLVEDKLTIPLGFARDFKGTLSTAWRLQRRERAVRLTPQANGLLLEFQRTGDTPFAVRIEAKQSGPGMSTIAPSPPDRPFNFTYKDCDLEQRLTLQLGDERHELSARGMLDFTLGYPPRRTFWNWAAGNGSAGDARLGFNLVAHFNGGLENALWVDDRIVALGQASFLYDPKAPLKPWRVVTEDGVLDAAFEPDGQRSENIQALVLGSSFIQLFGRFVGSVTLAGVRQDFMAYGVVEEHHAIW